VHSVLGTVANVADVTQVDKLLHGDENVVYADAGYTGVEKRPKHEDREVIWQIAARRSTYKKLDKRGALYKAKRKIEKTKARVRAKVEHPFRVIKRQFGYTKVRFRGLVKNTPSWSRCSRCRTCGWHADIYWLIQERCAGKAGNCCREVLAAAKHAEVSG